MHFISVNRKMLEEAGLVPSRQVVHAWFGLEAEIAEVPDRCAIKVTGKSQFKLYVNGEATLFGPLRSAADTAYCDEIDIAPHLKKGVNHIALQVLSFPQNPADRSQSGAIYCYGDDDGPAISAEGSIGSVDLSSPESWYVYIDKSMGFNTYAIFLLGATEDVDGAEKSKNPFLQNVWDTAGLNKAVFGSWVDFDQNGTRRAKSIKPRPIPLLYRREKSFSEWEEKTVAANEKLSFVIDAGELTTAYFRIGFKGGRGSKVQVMYSESYFKKNEYGMTYKVLRDDSTGFIDGVYDMYTVNGTGEQYEPFSFRTFRFVQITVETADEPITVIPLPYVETAYPLENKNRPVFTDPEKEKLYDVALRTLQLCMHDTYEDCPYYEQLMYVCDSRLEMLFTYACSGDTRLAAHCIDLFASSLMDNGFIQSRFPSRELQVIPVFALYYLMMLEDYIKETKDTARMAKHIPIAERIVETFLSNRCPDGMLAPNGYWDFFDWAEAWTAQIGTPTAVKNGESALQNVFFVYAMQSLIRILPLYHRESLAEAYSKECDKILNLVEKTCYDEERGLYKEGPNTDEFTQHTQIFAVLSGLADGEKAKSIMEKVLTDKELIPCSFMQRFYLFRALEKVDMYDRTEALWDAWKKFLELHCTTFPETPFNPRSDCHGWSALPLYEFSKRE